MAIDSIGSGGGTISTVRDTLTSLRGISGVNQVNPTERDPRQAPPPQDDVRVSNASLTDPRAIEQQELDAVRQGLSDASAAGNVALAGARSVSETLDQIGGRLQQLTDSTLDTERRSALEAEIQDLVGQGLQAIERSGFDGVNLLDAEQDQDLQVAADREGGTETVRDQDLRSTLEALQGLGFASADDAEAALDGAFADARAATGAAIGALAEDTGRIADRIAEIQEQQAAGLGVDQDVDAGLDAQGAQQLAGQIQQALGGQPLGIANSRPEALVGLFR